MVFIGLGIITTNETQIYKSKLKLRTMIKEEQYLEAIKIIEAYEEQLCIANIGRRSEQLCSECKIPMKPLYDKMACFKCMTHTP